MKRVLIVGGANGIGLAIASQLVKRTNCEKIYIVDKQPLNQLYKHKKIESYIFDLTESDFSFFNQFNDVDSLIITAGFGRLSLFKDIEDQHIVNSFKVNTISVLRLIKRFYNKIESKEDFYCGVMCSIAGFMTSPFFSIYGATKAALKIFIESVNVELEKSGTTNRILNVSPGSIKGTSFYQGETDLNMLEDLALNIIRRLETKQDLYIPQYDEIYKEVLDRYQKDFRAEGLHSYEYKLNSGRVRKD